MNSIITNNIKRIITITAQQHSSTAATTTKQLTEKHLRKIKKSNIYSKKVTVAATVIIESNKNTTSFSYNTIPYYNTILYYNTIQYCLFLFFFNTRLAVALCVPVHSMLNSYWVE